MRRAWSFATVVVAVALGFVLGRWTSAPDGPGVGVPRAAALASSPHLWTQASPHNRCRVHRVVDGDTVEVDCFGTRERVRMLQINTPERGQPGFRGASEALRAMIDGAQVTLEYAEPGKPTRGHYGRLLAYIFVGDLNTNVEMVRQGWTRYWIKYGRSRFERDFIAAEREAPPRGLRLTQR